MLTMEERSCERSGRRRFSGEVFEDVDTCSLQVLPIQPCAPCCAESMNTCVAGWDCVIMNSSGTVHWSLDQRLGAWRLALSSGRYMAPRRINVGLIGPGLVGKELLRQISQQVRCVLILYT